MHTMFVACGLGAVTGARSMLGPAFAAYRLSRRHTDDPSDGVAARVLGSPGAARLLPLLAAGEIVADKMPWIPARTDVMPLAARVAGGALAGAAISAPRRRRAAAMAAACGAFGAAHALFRLRRMATVRFGVPNPVAGLCEDVCVFAAAVLLTRDRRLRPPRVPPPARL